MSLARVLYILGIILMVWAMISGAHFMYKVSAGESSFTGGYSFKLGLFLVGLVLVYLGRKSSQNK